MRPLLLLVLLATIAGCDSHAIPPHTLLYGGDPRVNIWLYQRVAGGGYADRPLQPGERAVLEGGATVTLTEGRVSVNGKVVNAASAVVDKNGEVYEGAFIRTFD
jgi:hypothetical protein